SNARPGILYLTSTQAVAVPKTVLISATTNDVHAVSQRALFATGALMCWTKFVQPSDRPKLTRPRSGKATSSATYRMTPDLSARSIRLGARAGFMAGFSCFVKRRGHRLHPGQRGAFGPWPNRLNP